MSWAGNTIARSLALVAIATGAAFVHWGFTPLTLTLRDPRGAQPNGAEAPSTGAATGGPASAGGPENTASPPAPESAGEDADPQAPFDPARLGTDIGTEEAHQLWLTGAVTFIDARPAKDYESGHIPFAYLVPAESIGQGRLGDLIEVAGLDLSSRVVVYCEGGSCDASHLVALTLQDMGFEKIHIYTEGYPAWESAGHEVQSGSDEMLGDVP